MTISAVVHSMFGNGKSGARPPATAGTDIKAVRCFAQYRHCFSSMEVAYPGLSLRNQAVARWVREHDVGVQVRSSEELATVISAGVHPVRMTVHASGVLTDELVFCAASLAVGFIIVDTVEHVDVLIRAIGPRRRQPVLVGVSDGASHGEHGETATMRRAAVAAARLNLTGLHADIGLTARDFVSYPAAVGDLVCRMHRIRETHSRVLTRLSLGGVPNPTHDWIAEVSRQAALIEQSLDDACLTVCFPRPAVVVSAVAPASGTRAA